MIGPRTQEAALLLEVLAELRAIRTFLEGLAATPQEEVVAPGEEQTAPSGAAAPQPEETAAPTVEPVVDRPRRRRRAEVEE